MLRIKLARFGKKGQPHYRIVVTEKRSKRDGKYNEAVGIYAPTQSPKILEVDVEKYDTWVARGAQPTDTVGNLVERFKSGNPFPAKIKRPSKKAQAKAAAEKEAAEQSAEEAAKVAETSDTAETPTEEQTEAAKTEETPAEEKKEEKAE